MEVVGWGGVNLCGEVVVWYGSVVKCGGEVRWWCGLVVSLSVVLVH